MKIIYRINDGLWWTRDFDDILFRLKSDNSYCAEIIAEAYCKRNSDYYPVVVDIVQRCHFVRFNVDVIPIPLFEAIRQERPYK